MVLRLANELYHHGTIGQKWYHRRYQNQDGSLTEEGRKHYGVGPARTKTQSHWGLKSVSGYDEAMANRPTTTRLRNRTNRDYEQIKDIQDWEDNERKHILRGKQLIHNLGIANYKLSRIFDDVDAEANLPKLRRPDTPEEALKKTNISKGTHLATGNNCCLCTIAYDLRRRGYDVISKQNAPINLLWDISAEDVSWMYNFPKEIRCENVDDLQQRLNKQPNGARGAAFCKWGEGTGGHVVAYEVQNGKARLYDSQEGKKYENVKDLFDDVIRCSYIRLDDKEPNYNFVKIAVE